MDFVPAKKNRSLIINVTSLIDVMFLLLIFFMVSSTFKNQPAINLVLPRSATAEETVVTPTVLYLTSDGRVFGVLRQLQGATGEDRVVIRADESAPHGAVVELIDLVKQSGYTRVSISARSGTR